jgi:hypothetical protein
MKKVISLVTLLVVFVSLMQVNVFAARDHETDESAQTLNNLGMFRGTNRGYELDREMTRVEGLVMSVRLLGKEKEALETRSKTSKFKDVPSWAEHYVEYAYVNGLTNGISETEFGTQLIVDEKSYLTFMLRGLGYDDEKGDFSWSKAKEKANGLGIVKTWNKDNAKLTRGEVTKISLATLSTNIKDQKETLIYKLIKDDVINSRAAVDAGIISEEQLTEINTLINEELIVEEALIEYQPSTYVPSHDTNYVPKPVVEKPAVEKSAVEKPAIEEPAVEEPAIEEPAVEEPAIEEPAVEEPAAEEPVVEVPVVEEPAVEVPAVEEPAVEVPAVEEPAVEVPAVEEPLVEVPVVEEPAVEVPAVEEPAVEVPAVEEPVVEVPAVEEPVVVEPAVEEIANAAYVPSSLLSEGKVNDATPIEAFLSANNGKTIIFPGGTYELDAPLDVVNLTDTVIDFNNTTFKFRDGFSGWSSAEKSAGGSYIGDAVIGFVGNNNVTVKNMSIDGNRDGMSMEQRTIGIWVVNSENIDFIDAEIINVNYHGLVIYGGTKDVHFEGLHLKDNYGSWQCSDVYIANGTSDDCSFNDTFAERTFLETMDGCQVFYIHGYNSTITNLEIVNCSIGVDYRLGTHYGENFVMDNVNGVVYVQSVNNTERATVVIKNVTATNIQADINTRAAVAIWDTDSAYFENINLTFSEETTTGNYGILLRRFGSEDVIKNVKFKDVKILNSDYAAVYYLNMNETSVIENLVADPDNGYLLGADNTTATQTVTNITSTSNSISDTNNVINETFAQ